MAVRVEYRGSYNALARNMDMRWLHLLPVYLLVAVLVMVGLHRAAPVPLLTAEIWTWLGWLAILGGLGVAIHVDAVFRRHATTIRPFETSSALVTDGLLRYSRNPIYCGMVVAVIGLGLLLGSVLPFVVVPVFAVLIDRLFVRREEQDLEAVFGDDYRAYRARVRRWV